MLIITYVQNLIYDISHTECWVITHFGPLSVLHVRKEYFQSRIFPFFRQKNMNGLFSLASLNSYQGVIWWYARHDKLHIQIIRNDTH